MTLTRIRATKNIPLNRYEAEGAIDTAADSVRARFATPNMHQIYSDKRAEAERYLKLLAEGTGPDMAEFPYLSAEIGITAATATDLANLWIYMNQQWQTVASIIEQIRIASKAQIRDAASQKQIDTLVQQAKFALDAIGDRPPERPKPVPAPF